MVKIRVTFPSRVIELLAFARLVLTAIRASAFFQGLSAEFAALLARLTEVNEKLETAYHAAINRDKERIRERREIERELKAILLKIARSVELVADGDPAIMRSAGFEVSEQKPVRGKYRGLLRAPAFTLDHGPTRGSLWAKAKAVPGSGSFDCRISYGDPHNLEGYQQYGVFRSGKILISGLKSGNDISVILRCIGDDGPGDWSAPITLMPL